jgi:hypothetical protein
MNSMENNSENQNFPPISSAPSRPPLLPKPPVLSGAPGEDSMQIDLINPEMVSAQNRSILKIVIFGLIALALVIAFYLVASNKGLSGTKVSGNQAVFQFQGEDIAGQLGSEETQGFVTNGGQTETNDSGLFGVIPSEKVRYLEQKYSDIIHCGSAGEEEVKSNEFSAYLLAGNSSAKAGLQKLNELMEEQKWVEFEIEGRKISQMQGNQNGKNFTLISQSNLIFYLVDKLKIVNEDYK